MKPVLLYYFTSRKVWKDAFMVFACLISSFLSSFNLLYAIFLDLGWLSSCVCRPIPIYKVKEQTEPQVFYGDFTINVWSLRHCIIFHERPLIEYAGLSHSSLREVHSH